MWILFLNDMRMGHVEDLVAVGWAETREALQAVLASEKVDAYRDGRWHKTFRAGGPLEWCNPPFGGDMGDGRTFVEAPPSITIAGCVEYSNPRPACPPLVTP